MSFYDTGNNIHTQLENLKNKSLYRTLRSFEKKSGCNIVYNGKKYINLTSNDYLSISQIKFQKDFIEKFKSVDEFVMSASSSRLLTGNSYYYDELEDIVRKNYEKEAAIVFNSGYHANIGIIPCIAQSGDLILSDRLNHASIIDGIRLSRADHKRFKHRDYEHVENLLKKYRDKYKNVIIISESVFSMDGDIADIERLTYLKEKYNVILYIDEAHGVGCYGKKGLGICEMKGLINKVDIIVGTFGKALASIGAYGVMDNILREYLINSMRTLIFTTGLPPFNLKWNTFIFKKMIDMEENRNKLFEISDRMRKSLKEINLVTCGNSHIIPVIIGENDISVRVSEKLMEKDFFALPVRPPTVPEKTSRIRLSLNAGMSWEDLKEIPEIINEAIS